jgi:uncharacterized protein (TIGR00730 family)
MLNKFSEKQEKSIFLLSPSHQNQTNKLITKSFFRKNGAHLDKHTALENFKEDLKICYSLKYPSKLVAVFGSARISDCFYPKLAEKCYLLSFQLGKKGYIISTGGGPGIMHYASIGAIDGGSYSLGFQPRFISEFEKPILLEGKILYSVASLHSRKLLMANNASALVFFPGGAGTVDEFFHYLSFLEKGWINNTPFILFDSNFWHGLINWIKNKLVLNSYASRSILNNIYLVDSQKDALDIIQKSNFSFKPNIKRVLSSFEKDISHIYNVVENLIRPSASFFGSLKSNYKNKKLKDLIKQTSLVLGKNNYTIYYSNSNGFSEVLNSAFSNKNGSKPKTIQVPIQLLETQKLLLGATDKLIFFPGGIEVIDAFSEYIVRIQIGDMEKTNIFLFDSEFWGQYIKWFFNYPIRYGFAEKELLDLSPIISNPKEILFNK